MAVEKDGKFYVVGGTRRFLMLLHHQRQGRKDYATALADEAADFGLDQEALAAMKEPVLVLGWISLQRLPLEYLPAFSSQNISIRAPYPSSSPEEVERLIVQPLEDSLGTINGVDRLSARASSLASMAASRVASRVSRSLTLSSKSPVCSVFTGVLPRFSEVTCPLSLYCGKRTSESS